MNGGRFVFGRTPKNFKLQTRTRFSSNLRIVGGQDADPYEWPWLAAIVSSTKIHHFLSQMFRTSRKSFCGATLISDTQVITAAHCLEEINHSNKSFIIRAGNLKLRKEIHTILQ